MSATSADRVVAIAIAELQEHEAERAESVAEMLSILRSIPGKLDHNEREEASRLATAAADLEYELTGDASCVGDLMETLGLEDGAAPRED